MASNLRPAPSKVLAFADARLPCTLSMLEPTGPETYALVDTPIGKLVARVAGKLAQRAGDRGFLRWSATDAHLFDSHSENRVA